MVDIAKTCTLYSLDDTGFPLSDLRTNKMLDDFGKTDYSVTDKESVRLIERYGRRYLSATYIMDVFLNNMDDGTQCYKYKMTALEKMPVHEMTWKRYAATMADRIAFEETYLNNILFNVHVAENTKVRDVLHNHIKPKYKEKVAMLMDYLQKSSIANQSEKISVWDNEWQAITHEMYDNTRIVDGWRNDMRKIASEQASILDHIAKKAASAQFESFQVTDGYKHVWTILHTFREELKTLDKVHRDIYAVRDDRIAIADKRLVKLERTLHEAVDTDESFNRNVAFVRGLAELARIGDGLTRDIGKNPAEDIALYDAYVRASNSYIESVQVVSSFKEMDDFTAMADTPPMYEQFTDFNVGDYEYEKALLRLRIVSKATQAQPLLYDVSPHVDIDDTDDKGQVQIKDTTAATKVYYNKHYYNAPEVNAMVKGGTGATTPVPNILTTDGQDDKGRYFEIELLNSSGNRTTGIVSWVAKGW